MLQAYYRDDYNRIMFVEWTVGSPSPFKDQPNSIWSVGEVRASGKELELIEDTLKFLPAVENTNPNKPVRYFGDIAKFIVGNLL